MPVAALTMEDLHISVVIPTYNRGDLIGRAIQSVLEQTRRPHEVIVVDDGSTDDTRHVVSAFGGDIRYIHQTNAGASLARNRGVREAKAEWVAFLDSDDVWLEQHLDRMAQAIVQTNGAADFYFADMEQTDNEGGGKLWEFCRFGIKGKYEMTRDGAEWVMMERQPMMLQTSVFRKSAYTESGGLWERLKTRHDTHFFLKIGIGRPVCAVAGCGARQTSDDDPTNRLMSASGPESLRFWDETIPMYEDILAHPLKMTNQHRYLIRSRLANAHWRVSRFAWRERRIRESAVQAAKCLVVEPFTLLSILIHAPQVRLGLKSR